MIDQIVDVGDRRMVVQVFLRRVQPQVVVAQFAADVRPMFRPLKGDDDIGFALGQADEVRQWQDVHRDSRVGVGEMAQLRGDEEAAEPFGAAHSHVTRQRDA